MLRRLYFEMRSGAPAAARSGSEAILYQANGHTSQESLKWGIVSTARINTEVIPGIRGAGGNELVAVGSRDEERARAYADAHDIPRAFGDYGALFEDPDIDCVYISVPNSLHAPLSVVRSWFHFRVADPASDVRYRPELGGGALRDVGSYCTSAAMYLLDERPHRVAASARLAASGVDETTTGMLEFSSGACAVFDCGRELRGCGGR